MITAKYLSRLRLDVVQKAADKKNKRVLFKIGAYVRQVIRSTLNKKKTKTRKVSSPGDPPLNITNRLRGAVVFAVDQNALTVTIGPQQFAGSRVPEILEFGGREKIELPNGEKIAAEFKPRPYLQPNESDAEKRFLDLMANDPF